MAFIALKSLLQIYRPASTVVFFATSSLEILSRIVVSIGCQQLWSGFEAGICWERPSEVSFENVNFAQVLAGEENTPGL